MGIQIVQTEETQVGYFAPEEPVDSSTVGNQSEDP